MYSVITLILLDSVDFMSHMTHDTSVAIDICEKIQKEFLMKELIDNSILYQKSNIY